MCTIKMAIDFWSNMCHLNGNEECLLCAIEMAMNV